MKKIYLILPILAGIMFGSSGIFVRTLTQNGIDQPTLLFLRFSIAIVPILIAILLTDRELFKIELKDIPLFLACSLCILGLNLCYNQSMNTVPLSLAAVLLSIAPIYVLVIAYFLFGEKITSKKLVCMILAIFGCILMTGVLESDLGSISTFGILSGIGAGSYGLKKIHRKRKSYLYNTVLFHNIHHDSPDTIQRFRPDFKLRLHQSCIHNNVSDTAFYILICAALHLLDPKPEIY